MERRSFLSGAVASPVLCRISAVRSAPSLLANVPSDLGEKGGRPWDLDENDLVIHDGNMIALVTTGLYVVTYHALMGGFGLGTIEILEDDACIASESVNFSEWDTCPIQNMHVQAMISVTEKNCEKIVRARPSSTFMDSTVWIDRIFARVTRVGPCSGSM